MQSIGQNRQGYSMVDMQRPAVAYGGGQIQGGGGGYGYNPQPQPPTPNPDPEPIPPEDCCTECCQCLPADIPSDTEKTRRYLTFLGICTSFAVVLSLASFIWVAVHSTNDDEHGHPHYPPTNNTDSDDMDGGFLPAPYGWNRMEGLYKTDLLVEHGVNGEKRFKKAFFTVTESTAAHSASGQAGYLEGTLCGTMQREDGKWTSSVPDQMFAMLQEKNELDDKVVYRARGVADVWGLTTEYKGLMEFRMIGRKLQFLQTSEQIRVTSIADFKRQGDSEKIECPTRNHANSFYSDSQGVPFSTSTDLVDPWAKLEGTYILDKSLELLGNEDNYQTFKDATITISYSTEGRVRGKLCGLMEKENGDLTSEKDDREFYLLGFHDGNEFYLRGNSPGWFFNLKGNIEMRIVMPVKESKTSMWFTHTSTDANTVTVGSFYKYESWEAGQKPSSTCPTSNNLLSRAGPQSSPEYMRWDGVEGVYKADIMEMLDGDNMKVKEYHEVYLVVDEGVKFRINGKLCGRMKKPNGHWVTADDRTFRSLSYHHSKIYRAFSVNPGYMFSAKGVLDLKHVERNEEIHFNHYSEKAGYTTHAIFKRDEKYQEEHGANCPKKDE